MIGVLIKRGILDTEKYIQKKKKDMKTPIGRTSGEDQNYDAFSSVQLLSHVRLFVTP